MTKVAGSWGTSPPAAIVGPGTRVRGGRSATQLQVRPSLPFLNRTSTSRIVRAASSPTLPAHGGLSHKAPSAEAALCASGVAERAGTIGHIPWGELGRGAWHAGVPNDRRHLPGRPRLLAPAHG